MSRTLQQEGVKKPVSTTNVPRSSNHRKDESKLPPTIENLAGTASKPKGLKPSAAQRTRFPPSSCPWKGCASPCSRAMGPEAAENITSGLTQTAGEVQLFWLKDSGVILCCHLIHPYNPGNLQPAHLKTGLKLMAHLWLTLTFGPLLFPLP